MTYCVKHPDRVYNGAIRGFPLCSACFAYVEIYLMPDGRTLDTVGFEKFLKLGIPVTDNKKDTNPKDAVGIKKVPMSVIPAPVIAEVGLALLEGSLKYGRHNYRVVGVRASVYYDAVMQRHMPAWWEGQDIDVDSGLSHITKAIASLVVLRDAMMNDMMTDDRPPKHKNQNWVSDLNKKAAELIEKYPNPVAAFTETVLDTRSDADLDDLATQTNRELDPEEKSE